MPLAVCLLLDEQSEAVLRGLWQRLEAAGVPTLLSHTHGRHRPHLTFASLRYAGGSSADRAETVVKVLSRLPEAPPTTLYLDALGTFRRSRCWLAPAVDPALVRRQQEVIEVLADTGADLHRHYLAGRWVPHLTVAPRLHLSDLPVVARHVYDVLPVQAVADRAAVIDTSTGEVHPMPHPV